MSKLCHFGVALWPEAPKPRVTAAVMCREGGTLATGTEEGDVWLWRVPSTWFNTSANLKPPPSGGLAGDHDRVGEVHPAALLCGEHKSAICCLTVVCDGGCRVLVSADADACVCIWRMEDGICIRSCRGFLPWAPTSMIDVSCKGKSLLACTGGSPDIEVFDVSSMRRLVRLFGHGEWCASICTGFVASSASGGRADTRGAEPTIFSIDRGGTLCCWQPDGSSAQNVVGWIPSVQVHCVPITFPTCLAVDMESQRLVVVGIGECIAYPLDTNKRCVEREAEPPLISLGGEDRQGVMRDVAVDDSDTPERMRRRRHASVAASRPPLRRWDSAPSSNNEMQAEDLRRSPEGQAAGSEAMGMIEVVKGMLGHTRGLSDMQRWTRMSAVVLPGAEKAVVWEQGAGLYMVNLLQCNSKAICKEDSPMILTGDVHGWIVVAGCEGQVNVWSPSPVKASLSQVTQTLSAHAALKERMKRGSSSRLDAGEEGHGSGAYSPSGSASAPNEVGTHGFGVGNMSVWEGPATPGSVSSELKGPTGFAGLSQVWSFAGSGSIDMGWEVDSSGGGGGVAASCKSSLSWGGQLQHSSASWSSMIKIQGAPTSRDELRDGSKHSSNGADVKAYWVFALQSGGINVHQLPDGKLCARFEGHGCPVRSLMWPDNKGVVISGADDGSVKVWRVKDSSLLHTFQHHTGAVRMLTMLDPSASLLLSARPVFCSCADDKTVMLATVDRGGDGNPCRLLGLLQGHSSPVTSIQWAGRHGHLYVVCTDGTLHIWQLTQQQPSQLLRVVPASSARLVLSALDRKTSSMGSMSVTDGSSFPVRGGDDGDLETREDLMMQMLVEEDEQDVIERTPPLEASGLSARAGCPAVLLVHADVISVIASRRREGATSSVVGSPGGAGRQQSAQPSPASDLDSLSPMASPSPGSGYNENGSLSSPSPTSSPEKRGASKTALLSKEQAAGGRALLEHQNSLLSLGISAVLSMISCPKHAPHHVKASIACALTDLGVPPFLSPERTGTFDSSGAFTAPSLKASCVLSGAGNALTCLVPCTSAHSGSLSISPSFTSCVSMCAAVLLDTSRALAQAKSRGAEASGELLQFVVKGLAAKMPRFVDSDVISLAKYWLLAPDPARQAAHLLLTATLGRTDAAKRKDIVAEWTRKLGQADVAAREERKAAETLTKFDGQSQLRAVMQAAAQAGGAAGGGASPSNQAGPDGFSGKEGPALVVLAVIGSHFQEALDRATCARVSDSLVRAVSSTNALHAKVASHLLSRGAKVWAPHIRDGEGLMRVLYVRYWRHTDYQSTMADTEWALRCMAPLLPAEFVEVVGEEASRHSQLVCHVRSERSVAAIKVLVALFKRNPVEMLPALPRAVEVVLRTLDPGHPLVRQALMQHSTAALKEIVRKFPMTAFHQDTQRFAVGTVDALIVIYDLRTATKWRVLEGHEGPISAVTFDAGGHRLATFSGDEGRLRYWEAGSSGPFGLFASKVGRCVQQFTVPKALVPKISKGSLDSIAFRVLFTPNAIVLTRDSVPLCEFPLG